MNRWITGIAAILIGIVMAVGHAEAARVGGGKSTGTQREGVSQALLARHLNVSTKLVSDWERGVKSPSGPSLKLLSIVKARGLEGVA